MNGTFLITSGINYQETEKFTKNKGACSHILQTPLPKLSSRANRIRTSQVLVSSTRPRRPLRTSSTKLPDDFPLGEFLVYLQKPLMSVSPDSHTTRLYSHSAVRVETRILRALIQVSDILHYEICTRSDAAHGAEQPSSK